MSYLKTNPEELKNTVIRMQGILTEMKNIFHEADTAIDRMMVSYSGQDASAFLQKWKEISAKDAVYGKMTEELAELFEYMEYCSAFYEAAQTIITDEASHL